MEEEAFEEVGLNDEKPKKKGFLSRFGDSSNDAQSSGSKSSTSSFGFHIPGRKRGQSGGGSELASVKATSFEPAPPGGIWSDEISLMRCDSLYGVSGLFRVMQATLVQE